MFGPNDYDLEDVELPAVEVEIKIEVNDVQVAEVDNWADLSSWLRENVDYGS